MKKRKISKIGKKWIARKATGYLVGSLIVAISMWKMLLWALESSPYWNGMLWIVAFFIGFSIITYFWEEKFSSYKEKAKKRRR